MSVETASLSITTIVISVCIQQNVLSEVLTHLCISIAFSSAKIDASALKRITGLLYHCFILRQTEQDAYKTCGREKEEEVHQGQGI